MPTGKVILLNGCSSSGKTSILCTLQGLLDEPYLEAGIDKFIWMLPARYLDRPLWDEVLGRADRAGLAGRRDRTIGQARLQHALVHRQGGYDLEVNSARLDPQQCAMAILSRLQTPPQAFTWMHSTGML